MTDMNFDGALDRLAAAAAAASSYMNFDGALDRLAAVASASCAATYIQDVPGDVMSATRTAMADGRSAIFAAGASAGMDPGDLERYLAALGLPPADPDQET